MQAVASAIGTATVMTRVVLTTSCTLARTAVSLPATLRAKEQKKARPALSAAGTLPTKLTGNANLPQVGISPCDIYMYTIKWIC